MALLRQNGCPSAFLTLSCAEFDWPELLKEIVETVERREVTMEYVQNLPEKVKNKLISENVVQSTLHFQKRVDKIFSLIILISNLVRIFLKSRNRRYPEVCFNGLYQRGQVHTDLIELHKAYEDRQCATKKQGNDTFKSLIFEQTSNG